MFSHKDAFLFKERVFMCWLAGDISRPIHMVQNKSVVKFHRIDAEKIIEYNYLIQEKYSIFIV